MSKPKDLTKTYYRLKKCPYTNEVISNEQYLLYKVMDEKSVDLADKIMENSDVNLESENTLTLV